MRMTSKGQVTIPKELRDKAGLFPGSKVEFAFENGEIRVRKAKGYSRGEEVVRRLRGTATVKMTTDEIMALTRK